MAWNSHYWGIVEQLYWSPKYIGFKSINRKYWSQENGRISIPPNMVSASSSLYTRKLKYREIVEYLHKQEEILNQIFNITFSIAPDKLLQGLFLNPLGIEDSGPIESVGREIAVQFGWNEGDNVTQHDGFFLSKRSAIGVELKFGSPSSTGQILKYAAMFTWQEIISGSKENLGLLYIVPASALNQHWKKCGLTGPHVDRSLLSTAWRKPLPLRINQLVEDSGEQVASVLDRMSLAVISWSDFYDKLNAFDQSLDKKQAGDQTIHRLLAGFLDQLRLHQGTEIA